MNKNEIYKLGYGFALGNSLDVNTTDGPKSKDIYWETGWGNNIIDSNLIKSIKNRGFKTVKVPISWEDHMQYSDDCTSGECDDWWCTRCKQVVQMVLNEGLYCIINTQHDSDWIRSINDPILDDNRKETIVNKFRTLWKVISNIFKDFDKDKLFYESMNEVGFSKPNSKYFVDLCNSFIEECRNSDQDNDRLLILSGVYCDTNTTLQQFPIDSVIKDDNYVLSLHLYTPGSFTLANNILDKISDISVADNIREGNAEITYYDGDYLGNNYSDESYTDNYGTEVLIKNYNHDELAEALGNIEKIESIYNTKVIISEFGCNPFFRDKDAVYDWFKQVTVYCQEHKIPLVLWNNGNKFQCIIRKTMQDRRSIDMEKIIGNYNNIVFEEELSESYRSDTDDFTNQLDIDRSLV